MQIENESAPRPKLFKDRAMRIGKEEYARLVGELMNKVGEAFESISPVEQLMDKESFGDIDLVCLGVKEMDREFFDRLLGEQLIDYKRNGSIHSLLVGVNDNMTIQVDFIKADDKEDYDRKLIFYGKGHLSAMIKMMAGKLHFKYGTEGFFKRFRDQKGNWHDILLTEDLKKGIRILGLDPDRYTGVRTEDDIIEFVSSSVYFDSRDFQRENLARHHRESIKRVAMQKRMAGRLADKDRSRTVIDEDRLLMELFPAVYERYHEEGRRINAEVVQKKKIDGDMVMKVFDLNPGPKVGDVLGYIAREYPDIDELSDEMVERVKNDVLVG